MQIRPEAQRDLAEVSAVITAAFREAEHRGGNEAEIVEALRSAGSLAIALVASKDDRLVGYVAFSPVLIDGKDQGWFGLGPVAVLPQEQHQGIGAALIEAGLLMLREQGAAGCVVLGDPAYYRRFGFVAEPSLRMEGVPSEYFQQLRFGEKSVHGVVQYHPAFAVG